MMHVIRGRIALILLSALLLGAGGCAGARPQATPHPDAAQLCGLWQQFVPVGSLPVEITLEPSGAAKLDEEAGRWRLDGDRLLIRQGGRDEAYSYTVSGYMLTLFHTGSETSGFYISPQGFANGADGNGDLAGQWAAWSGWGRMVFDGRSGLKSIVDTTAGRTEILQEYAARDGILQTVDTSGNYTYNLYAFSREGALLLAETEDYDSDNKRWSDYWKKTDPGDAMMGGWTRAVSAGAGEGMPAVLRLEKNGGGSATLGGAAGAIRWEYYDAGFLLLETGEPGVLYAWCDVQGGVLYLGNADVDECWYVDDSRYRPTTEPLQELAGRWREEAGGGMALEFLADGTLKATNGAGETAVLAATAADGLLRLQRNGKTHYAAYYYDGGQMRLYYSGLPFLDDREMPVTLVSDQNPG